MDVEAWQDLCARRDRWKAGSATDVAPQSARSFSEPRRIILDLPYPPSVNDLYGHDPKSGRKYLVDQQREYRSSVVGYVAKQLGDQFEPLRGWLHMAVTLYPPDARRRDVSNCLKALEDALQAARVFLDDYQIESHATMRMRELHENRCRVTLEEIDK